MRNRKKRFPALLLITLLLVFLYADQHLLVVDRYEVSMPGLPESFDGLRIVLLSDLHGREFGKNNERLVARVEAERPDMIALTGDFVSVEEDLAGFGALLPRLRALAPCYYVSGNHEWAHRQMSKAKELLREHDIDYLNNRYTFLERGGERLCICGSDDPNSAADMITPPELVEQLHLQEGDIPVVYLCHRNDAMEKWPALDVDVILCGHGHGGIVRLPGIGGLVGVNRRLFPAYSAGLYRSEHYSMVVSRGLGNIHHIPRVFNFPQIVVVTLKKSA